MKASTNQNPSQTISSLSAEDRAAFAGEFLTDSPDGYYADAGPEAGQVILSSVSKGFRFSIIIEKDDEDPFSPMVANALISLGESAAQTRNLEQENRILREQLAVARQEQFGASSEKHPSTEAVEQDDAPPQAEPEDTPKPQKPKIVRNAGRKPLPENLPRDIVVHEIPENERTCPCCGKPMRECGEDVTEQLTVIPAQFRVTKRIRKKYVCRGCDRFVVAQAPKSMVPGSSYASPEFLSHIAISKYQLGLPFYRQETVFEQSGLPFNRTTLANLMNTCADQLTPLFQLMKDELMEQKIIHADETTIQVLKEEDRKPQTKSYFWLYRSAKTALHQVVLFDYQQTRGGEHPRAFLEEFDGYLHVDGYFGYNNIRGTKRVGCMAHIRRKFIEAGKAVPNGLAGESHAQYAVDTIGELYDIERKLADQPLNVIHETRQRESIPIMLKFKEWLDGMKPKVLPRSLLGKAVLYAIEQWPAMMRYVGDAELAIDNNIAEREIKQVVIGRKNWLFADMPDGAYTNAVMYSVIQTAKANGLEPYAYLRHVFSTLPGLTKAEDVRQLLPWAVKIETEQEPLAA